MLLFFEHVCIVKRKDIDFTFYYANSQSQSNKSEWIGNYIDRNGFFFLFLAMVVGHVSALRLYLCVLNSIKAKHAVYANFGLLGRGGIRGVYTLIRSCIKDGLRDCMVHLFGEICHWCNAKFFQPSTWCRLILLHQIGAVKLSAILCKSARR